MQVVMPIGDTEALRLITELKWFHVSLHTERYHYYDMVRWLNNNCTGSVGFLAALFVFELAEDAVIFKIRWAGVQDYEINF